MMKLKNGIRSLKRCNFVKSERSLDALINSSPDQIWLIDTDYRLVMANKSFFETTKMVYGLDVQLGQPLLFPGLPDSSISQKWEGFYNRALKGERFTVEYPADRGLPLEGNNYEVTFNPVRDENRKVVGTGCFSRDVTQRKKVEDLISSSVAEKLAGLLGEAVDKPEHELLSDREMQVLQHIASGRTVSEIAVEMSLSVNTISTYRARILEKLALH